jgi:hypothetical protein
MQWILRQLFSESLNFVKLSAIVNFCIANIQTIYSFAKKHSGLAFIKALKPYFCGTKKNVWILPFLKNN